MNNTLWIGVYPGLGSAEIDYMIDVINEFCLQRCRRQADEQRR
jgi:hypothetical protein